MRVRVPYDHNVNNDRKQSKTVKIMKNLSIDAKIGVNGNVPVACMFRLHDGLMFWHGCPKKFGHRQYDKFICPSNAMLGTYDELTIDSITAAVSIYLKSGIFGDIKDINFAEFSEPKTVNEKPSKLAKFGFGPEAGNAPEPTPTPEPTPEPETHDEPAPEPVPDVTPEDDTTHEDEPTQPAPEPAMPETTPTPTPQAPSQQAAIDAFAALTPLFAGVQANVQAAVMEQLRPFMEQLQVAAQKKATKVVIKTPNNGEHEVTGKTCKLFGAMVQTLCEGEYLYLYGPAGCGKSYTAMQLAEALGVQFYGLQQVLYEHQITGFVDANGTYHGTPFSEAFINGGLILLDEFDASSEEAAIVINNALANGLLNIPGQGNVKKHEQCYVVAAGNTGCTGADMQYTARRVLDASTVDRFMFIAMDYDEDIELDNANGDQAIVDFAHDVRQAMKAAGLYHLFSYRTIKRLGNVNLQAAYGDAELLRSAFAKALDRDELRLIYSNLRDTNTRWAKALLKLL